MYFRFESFTVCDLGLFTVPSCWRASDNFWRWEGATVDTFRRGAPSTFLKGQERSLAPISASGRVTEMKRRGNSDHKVQVTH